MKGTLKVNGQLASGNIQFCSSNPNDPCPTPAAQGPSGPFDSFSSSGFTVALPPGSYRVHVTTSNGIDAGIVPITIVAGQLIDGSDMNFQVNLGAVAGTIKWGTETISARVLFTGNTNGFTFGRSPASPTYDTGFNLPQDTYTAQIFLRQDSNTRDVALIDTEQVTVNSGQTTTFNYDASNSTGLVKGNARVNGQLVGGNIQFCSSNPNDPCPTPISDGDGPFDSFSSSGFTVALPPGSYRVHVTTAFGVDLGIIPIDLSVGQLINLAFGDAPTPTVTPTPTPTVTPTNTPTPTPTPIPTYSLSGVVYNDINQNGFQDSGEAGYVGATVSLDNGQSSVSDSNGNYTIPNVISGAYVETLTVPSGYSATTTNPVNISVTTDTTQNFGIVFMPTPTPTNTPTPTSTPTPTPTPSSSTLNSVADSYVKQGSQNENEGSSTFLRLQSNGHNRALVKFDESQIQSAVGNSTNYTAKLRFTITDNGNNWGSSGRTIEVHKLTKDWIEGNGFIDGNSPSNKGTGSGLTWNCATDTNIANSNDDCSGSTAWNMDNSSSWPFIGSATATILITNNQSGTVDFDVTSDIQSFISNSSTNYGWIVKKTDEGANGRVQFGSRQSSSTPQLIISHN